MPKPRTLTGGQQSQADERARLALEIAHERREAEESRQRARWAEHRAEKAAMAPTLTERALSLPDSDRCRFLDGNKAPGSNTPTFHNDFGVATTFQPCFIEYVNRGTSIRKEVEMRDYLTCGEVATLLNLPADTVRKAVREDRIPNQQPTAGSYRIPIARFREHLATQGYTEQEIEAMRQRWELFMPRAS